MTKYYHIQSKASLFSLFIVVLTSSKNAEKLFYLWYNQSFKVILLSCLHIKGSKIHFLGQIKVKVSFSLVEQKMLSEPDFRFIQFFEKTVYSFQNW